MPKMKQFEATIHPASRDGHFISTKVELFGEKKPPKHALEARTMDELMIQVDKLGNDHGEGCAIWVRCLEKRKPAGFDKRTDKLYYNLDQAAA